MKRKHPRTRWLLAICLVMALGALVLAGCGGSGGSSSGSSTTASRAGSGSSGSESSGSEAAKGGAGIMDISEEAKTCLKEKGVELPEFKSGEGGPPGDGEKPEGGERPEGGETPEGNGKPEGGPPSGGGEQSEEMKKAFEECGVEMPAPKGGGSGEGGPRAVNSAAFKKQVKEYAACVRENGYEIAAPNFSGEGPVFEKEESESAAFKKASAKCQSLLGGTGPETSEAG